MPSVLWLAAGTALRGRFAPSVANLGHHSQSRYVVANVARFGIVTKRGDVPTINTKPRLPIACWFVRTVKPSSRGMDYARGAMPVLA